MAEAAINHGIIRKMVIILAMVTTFLMPSQAAVNVVFDVDHADRMELKLSWNSTFTLSDGTNNVTLPENYQVSITLKSGYFFSEPDGITINGKTPTSSDIYNTGSICSFYNITNGDRIKIKTVTEEEKNSSTFTLTVDKASNITLNRIIYDQSGSIKPENVTLSDGENTIGWNPNDNVVFDVKHKEDCKPIYELKINGVVQQGQNDLYTFTPEVGAKVDVTTLYPDIDCPVTFNFSTAAARSAIIGVALDGEPLTRPLDGFQAKAGQMVTIDFSSSYKIDEFTINGVSSGAGSNCSFYLKTPTEIKLTSHKYGNVTSRFTIDHSSYVKLYYSVPSSIEGEDPTNYTINVFDGVNTVSVPEKIGYLTMIPARGCQISSVVRNGTQTMETSQSAGSGGYYLAVESDNEYSVTTEKIYRPHHAIVYVADDLKQKVEGGMDDWILSSVQEELAYLQFGNNVLSFRDRDNDIVLSPKIKNGTLIKVYHNGTKLTPTNENTNRFTVTLKDGDRLWLSYTATPKNFTYKYDVTNDGRVSIADLTKCIDTITDVNGDGYKNQVDILELVDKVTGKR